MKRFVGAIAGAGLLLLAISCSKSDDQTGASAGASVSSYLSGVSAGAAAGTLNPGALPAATGGPTVTVTGNGVVINGGTNPVAVSASAALSKVYVSVTGASGYYEVPVSGTTANLTLSLAQAIPTTTFELSFSGVSSTGAVGAPLVVTTRTAKVGTGDVQISLSWDANSDVDLHVTDPSGEEIYWNNRRSASGGRLDLDSNSGCTIDGVRNENVTWPTGVAPRGTYTVKVDLWGSCGTTSSNFVVRVNKSGSSENFSGTLTGPGDHQSGRGSGTLVTTFAY